MKLTKAPFLILGLALWPLAGPAAQDQPAPPPVERDGAVQPQPESKPERDRERPPARERLANRERELTRELEAVRKRAEQLGRQGESPLDRNPDRDLPRQGPGRPLAGDDDMAYRLRERRQRELGQDQPAARLRDRFGARQFNGGGPRFGAPMDRGGLRPAVCPHCQRPFGPLQGERLGRRSQFGPNAPALRKSGAQRRLAWLAPRLTRERRDLIRDRLDRLDRTDRIRRERPVPRENDGVPSRPPAAR